MYVTYCKRQKMTTQNVIIWASTKYYEWAMYEIFSLSLLDIACGKTYVHTKKTKKIDRNSPNINSKICRKMSL